MHGSNSYSTQRIKVFHIEQPLFNNSLMAENQILQAKFLLIEDFIDVLQNVEVKSFSIERIARIPPKIAVSARVESMKNIPIPIICISLEFGNRSRLCVFIDDQTEN